MTISLASFHASDVATVDAATTEVATLPASNLFKRMPFDRWRTPTATGYVTLTYASALAVSQIALLYTNATAAATVRVRAGTNPTTVTSAPSFDSGTLDHQPGTRDWSTWARTHLLLDLSATHSALCWRIDVAQVSGATYYEAGRLGLLSPWRPSRGLDFGDEIAPIDATIHRRARNGTGYSIQGGLYREGRLRVSGTLLSELLSSAGDLRRRVEGRVPILYARAPRALSLGTSAVGGLSMYTDSDLMDQLLYAYLAPDLPYPTNESKVMQRMSVVLEEVVHP